MIGPAVVTLLTDDATTFALVGDRITPIQADRGDTFPLVVYELPDIKRQTGFDGYAGITTCNLAVTAVANTYSAVDTIAQSITAVLDGYRGTVLIPATIMARINPSFIAGKFALLGPVNGLTGSFCTLDPASTTPLTIQGIFIEDGSIDDHAIDPDNRDMLWYSKTIKFSITFEG
jgi:hypothetical protein